MYCVEVSDSSVPGLFADVPGVASLEVEGPGRCEGDCSVAGNFIGEEVGCEDRSRGFELFSDFFQEGQCIVGGSSEGRSQYSEAALQVEGRDDSGHLHRGVGTGGEGLWLSSAEDDSEVEVGQGQERAVF